MACEQKGTTLCLPKRLRELEEMHGGADLESKSSVSSLARGHFQLKAMVRQVTEVQCWKDASGKYVNQQLGRHFERGMASKVSLAPRGRRWHLLQGIAESFPFASEHLGATIGRSPPQFDLDLMVFDEDSNREQLVYLPPSQVRLAESGEGIHAVKRFPRMVLQKKMVAKFDASGAYTVPFQQCIDSEVKILTRIVHPQVVQLQEALKTTS